MAADMTDMASDNTSLRNIAIKLLLVAGLVNAASGVGGGNTGILSRTSRSDASTHRFSLRHIVRHTPKVTFYNVSVSAIQAANLRAGKEDDDVEEDSIGPFSIMSSTTKIERLVKRAIPDVQDIMSEARYFGAAPILPQSYWTLDEVPSPNVTDRDTVINFALMSANAYSLEKNLGDWEDPMPPFNFSSSFGWKGDSLRGHVFANEDNSTIVLAIKGTSAAIWDGIETTTNDKINDNLFFSCCCGQGGQYLWLKVCDCMTSAYTCNQTCLFQALKEPDRYYSQAVELYGNVTEEYPDSNIWLTGHSLGGATASLLGLTFGIPVLTFESVPDALPAARLGLPVPPGTKIGTHQRRQYTGAYHFGHSADPVFMGTCNGAAFCTIGGYAMQSQCHTGNKCTWDTVGDKKWRQSLLNHGIRACIKDVYRAYKTLPECEHDTECVDCAVWKFFKSNHSDITTSKPASRVTFTKTTTSTSTCKTPGWWGCYDEPETTTTTFTTTTNANLITTSTTTLITETCRSYGWFGRCLDTHPTTDIITSTIPITLTLTSSTTPRTTSCATPGFFWGCDDDDNDDDHKKKKRRKSSSNRTRIPTSTVSSSTAATGVRAYEITPAPHIGL